MINWLNSETGGSITTNTPDTSPILGNAWLAGFIDADGSFGLNVRLKSEGAAKNRVEAGFRLEQRKTDPRTGESYLNVLTSIATALQVQLANSMHHDTQYYIIAVTSLKSRLLLVDYLNNYQLFTSKWLNYKDWLVAHNMMVNKEHITDAGRDKIIQLSQGMNSTRTLYNWDHLEVLKSY
jgi:hypothetical protein